MLVSPMNCEYRNPPHPKPSDPARLPMPIRVRALSAYEYPNLGLRSTKIRRIVSRASSVALKRGDAVVCMRRRTAEFALHSDFSIFCCRCGLRAG